MKTVLVAAIVVAAVALIPASSALACIGTSVCANNNISRQSGDSCGGGCFFYTYKNTGSVSGSGPVSGQIDMDGAGSVACTGPNQNLGSCSDETSDNNVYSVPTCHHGNQYGKSALSLNGVNDPDQMDC